MKGVLAEGLQQRERKGIGEYFAVLQSSQRFQFVLRTMEFLRVSPVRFRDFRWEISSALDISPSLYLRSSFNREAWRRPIHRQSFLE